MKKFIISTHSFDLGIGGLKVLHKLCHLLNKNGYDAYLVPVDFNQPFYVYEEYNVKIVTENILNNLQDAIVVYPESWYGNYLNAPNVVRWMIGPPSKSHINTWSEKDLWFWYIPYYITNEYNKNSDNILYVGEMHENIFYDYKIKRSGTCWTLRKSQGLILPDKYIHNNDSLFIPYQAAGDLNNLASIFNSKEKFYCYDNYTYLTIQSLMCNTDTIVIPHNNTKDQFINGFELNKYIAYGIEDLPRSKSIRNEFKDHLKLIEEKTEIQLHTFTQKCYDYFK